MNQKSEWQSLFSIYSSSDLKLLSIVLIARIAKLCFLFPSLSVLCTIKPFSFTVCHRPPSNSLKNYKNLFIWGTGSKSACPIDFKHNHFVVSTASVSPRLELHFFNCLTINWDFVVVNDAWISLHKTLTPLIKKKKL